MRKLSLVLALLFVGPSLALAQFGGVQGKHQTIQPTAQVTFLASTALNGSAASRTFTLSNPGGGFAIANLEMARTRVAGTDMTMTCVSTTDPVAAPVAVRTTCTYDATGLCASVTATMKSPTSVSETLAWQVDILGWKRTDCTVASTAAGASDLIVVTGGMVTK